MNGKRDNLSTADIKNQELIDNALIAAGLPQNKLNGLIAMIKERLICDTACQKERTKTDLKTKLDLAQNNLEQAPQKVKSAEKNYYVYTEGESGYDTLLYQRNEKNAESFKKNAMLHHMEQMKEMEILVKNYDADKLYVERMNELIKIKKEQEKTLKEDIDQYISHTQTNDRKVVYENKDMKWLNNFRFFLIIIYYILFIAYFFMSDFFTNEKYKSLKAWAFILAYVLFPSFLDLFTKQLAYLYFSIIYLITDNKWKNVYV